LFWGRIFGLPTTAGLVQLGRLPKPMGGVAKTAAKGPRKNSTLRATSKEVGRRDAQDARMRTRLSGVPATVRNQEGTCDQHLDL